MRDIEGVEHSICPTCYALATPYAGLQMTGGGRVVAAFTGEVHLTRSEDVAKLSDDSSTVWKKTDRLVANTGAQQTDTGIEWHVRVMNLDRVRGIRTIALCRLPETSVEVAGVLTFEQYAAQSQDDYPEPVPDPPTPTWPAFLAGTWERRLPTRPGIYPVRQQHVHGKPMCFPVIRAEVSRRKDVDPHMSYVGMDGTELRPSGILMALLVWSEPMPPLPEPQP